MIKLIMFDLDDTLVNHKKGAACALKNLTALLVKANYVDEYYDFSTFLDFYDRRNHRLWEEFSLGRIEIVELLTKRFEYIFDWFDVRQVDQELVMECYWKNYVSNCTLTEDWEPLLKALSEKTPLVICSNGWRDIQMAKLVKNKIEIYFKSFYFGSAKTYCKPNHDFFNDILNEYGVSPEDVLMIGDSISNDIVPCRDMGIKTLHYTGESAFDNVKATLREMANGTKVYI